LTPATAVDHIQPHRGDYELFWDSDNWQPLCATCHGRKTLAEVNARIHAKKLVATDR
jgi:5-methylcytosine-specific restriction protein A